MSKNLEIQTRAQQTRYLSREFLIGLAVNCVVVLCGGGYAYGSLAEKVSQVEPAKVTQLQEDVAVLKDKQLDADRVTRLEEQMKNLEKSLTRVQASLDRNFYGPTGK